MNSPTYKNTKITMDGESESGDLESSSPSVNNVDIMYSIVGLQEPPKLPLREEFMTHGVELVYNAKGVGQKVVCKEQKRREARLLQKLKLIERKLEKKRSYQQSKKRKKALDTVKKLRKAMENSASGISYEMYLEELMMMRESIISSVHDGPRTITPVTSVEHIEGKLMDALDLLDEPDLHAAASQVALADESDDDDEPTGDRSQGTADTSMETSMDTSMETSMEASGTTLEERETPSVAQIGNNDKSLDRRTSEEKDSTWTANNRQLNHSLRTQATSSTLKISNVKNVEDRSIEESLETVSFESTGSLSIVKSPSSSSVRFKDVKPSIDDNLSRARALIENARIVKRSFSNESNTSSIKPSDSYKSDRPQIQSSKFVPDIGRYHLFVSHACSWSHRSLIVRALKGLEKTVGMTYVECKLVGQHLIDTTAVKDAGRDISFWSIAGCNDDPDGVFGDFKSNFLDKRRDVCTRVPVLWDTVTKKIVTSKSTEIDWLFNFEFNRFARRPKLNLYPPGTKREIDEINRWIHDALSVGIYQCGIASTQAEYDRANDHLTRTLDRAETVVRKRGFLTGQKLTESDIRLFVYLIRFDEIYRVLFKTNSRRIATMPGLLEYVKDIYHVKGIKKVCDINAMKKEYFGALVKKGDPFIVPRGSFMKLLEQRSAVV